MPSYKQKLRKAQSCTCFCRMLPSPNTRVSCRLRIPRTYWLLTLTLDKYTKTDSPTKSKILERLSMDCNCITRVIQSIRALRRVLMRFFYPFLALMVACMFSAFFCRTPLQCIDWVLVLTWKVRPTMQKVANTRKAWNKANMMQWWRCHLRRRA